jgi:hypothetical protein
MPKKPTVFLDLLRRSSRGLATLCLGTGVEKFVEKNVANVHSAGAEFKADSG